MENCPSALVEVPLSDPLIVTEIPSNGFPLASLITLPFTVMSCPHAVIAEMQKRDNKHSSRLIMVFWL
jgi:hypothetical protein